MIRKVGKTPLQTGITLRKSSQKHAAKRGVVIVASHAFT